MKYIYKKTSVIFFTALLFLTIGSNSVFAGNTDSLLTDFLFKYQSAKNVPSISAALSIQGKTIWKRAAGYADVENNIQATDSTVYRIASVSKVITAAAIIQLVDAGKIKLDEDVRVYVPNYPVKRWKFTVRQVLSHTSGLRTYRDGEFDSKTKFNSTSEVVQYLANDSLEHEPGTKYLYSSLSFTLLAAVIENVSGLSYTDYVHKNIFDKAGMFHSDFDYYQKIIKNRARGYDKNGLRQIENTTLADLSIKFPGGGVLSTTGDLLNFADALMTGKLFSLKWLDTMAAPTKLKNGSLQYYGLGIGAWQDELKRIRMGHTGGGTGFCSQLTFLPKERIAAVYLINCRDHSLGNPVEDIISIAVDKKTVKPKKNLSDFLVAEILNKGLDSAVSVLKKILKDSTAVFDTSISEIKYCGSDLMNAGRYFEAGRLISAAIELTGDQLELLSLCGDAYAKDNNKGMALRYYKRAALLNPKDALTVKKIEALDAKK